MEASITGLAVAAGCKPRNHECHESILMPTLFEKPAVKHFEVRTSCITYNDHSKRYRYRIDRTNPAFNKMDNSRQQFFLYSHSSMLIICLIAIAAFKGRLAIRDGSLSRGLMVEAARP